MDGNSDTDFRNGHCSHTLPNNPSWWRVDLGSDHVPVIEVRIVNRLWRALLPQNMGYVITLGKHLEVICLAKIEKHSYLKQDFNEETKSINKIKLNELSYIIDL